ncbi:uncharacterized protein [Paramormyrops kingsleyae]|uniref:Si:ch211-105j21.9 n=1 Tax=Paramormyrops kingsleyae TaxID=1676925 RepID=A0A3B3RJW3_9TELE|nr:uncharacterized protein LOC111857072 [Paramormyrops kingsleyae]
MKMTLAQRFCRILFLASFVLTVLSEPLPTTGSSDEISTANGTDVVSTISAPNITVFSTTVLPNHTQNDSTTDIFSPNLTQDNLGFSKSTTLSQITNGAITPQITTGLQPSTKVTTTSNVTFPATTHGAWTTVNVSSTSNYTTYESQTTESHLNKNITAWTSAPGYFNTQEPPGGMTYSEQNMTILFSVVTGLAFLVMFTYAIYRCKRKTQYSHRPLYNSEETVDRFVAADDTLVISGGLYDGPRIYNPTMTTLHDEEFNADHPFPSQPTQFRLEFMNEDEENKSPDHGTCSFETFQPVGNDS